jgi:hypothetical protein
MQAGCFSYYSGRTIADEEKYRTAADGISGTVRVAMLDIIPAGAHVVEDNNWPESAAVATGRIVTPWRGSEPESPISLSDQVSE